MSAKSPPPATAPPPENRPAPVRAALASKVADMFDYLREHDYESTIECSPAPGEEGMVLQYFLDRARENGVCVHARAQHGYLMFHAHKNRCL